MGGGKHSYSKSQSKGIQNKLNAAWLRMKNLKRETESLDNRIK